MNSARGIAAIVVIGGTVASNNAGIYGGVGCDPRGKCTGGVCIIERIVTASAATAADFSV